MVRPSTPPLPTKQVKLHSEKETLEKDVEGDGRKYCKKKGVKFEKFTSPARRSVPDDMLTFEFGLIVFFEYKRPGKRASDKQFEDHVDRRNRNVLVEVVDDMDIGQALIDYYIEMDRNVDRVRCVTERVEWQRGHYATKKAIACLPN